MNFERFSELWKKIIGAQNNISGGMTEKTQKFLVDYALKGGKVKLGGVKPIPTNKRPGPQPKQFDILEENKDFLQSIIINEEDETLTIKLVTGEVTKFKIKAFEQYIDTSRKNVNKK